MYAFDPHAAVDRLAHVVDSQKPDAGCGQCFHLDTGTIERFRRHLDRHRVRVEPELDGGGVGGNGARRSSACA